MIFWRSTLRLKYGSEKIQIIETKLFIYIYNLRFTLTKTYTANSTQQRKVKKKKKPVSLRENATLHDLSSLKQIFSSLSRERKRQGKRKIQSFMIRNHHSPPELPVSAINGGSDGGSDQSSNSIRDRSLFKRNPNYNSNTPDKSSKSPLDRSDRRSRWHYTNKSYNRKGWLLPCLPFRGVYLFYCLIFFAVLAFVLASILLQSSITGMAMFGRGWIDHRRPIKEDLKSGAMLKFVPVLKSRLPLEGHGLDHVRLLANRVGLRPPRLAVVSFRVCLNLFFAVDEKCYFRRKIIRIDCKN